MKNLILMFTFFQLLSSFAFATDYFCNGQYKQSGSTCYYENGQSMGSCPNSITARISVKEYTIKLRVSLPSSEEPVFKDLMEMETSTEKFITNFYMSPSTGQINEVEATCVGSGDSDRVKNILNLYNSSSETEKAAVKREVCN